MCRVNARPSPQLILQRYAASMLKLFGQTRSRASRSLWMLEEIGIPYEHMPVRLCAALGILEDRLVGPYILGDDFTVGDLNLASTLREPGEDGISGIAAMDPVPFPNVGRWL